jgi:two-component system cell cycle sensor histidine kinase/response regulator CckA
MKKKEINKKPKKPPVNKKSPEQKAGSGVERRVSDSKRAEESLEKREVKYLDILENIDIAYFEIDLKGNFINFNDPVSRKLGYSREELLGMNYRVYSKPEDLEYLKGIYNEVYRTGKPKTMIDIVVIAKDSSQIMVEQSISLKRGPSGEPVGFEAVVRDITNRIVVENALKQSEERYRTILDAMEEGLFENDLEGNFTFVNDAACRLLGYERAEMIGMNYRKLFSPDKVKSIYNIFNEIYRTGEPRMLVDYEVLRKDGSVRIHQANAVLVRDTSNKPKGFRLLARDVTELKKAEEALRQSEQKYRMIAENVYDMIWITDLGLNCIYVSPSVFRITGFSPQEFQSKPINEMVTPASFDILAKIFSEELAREKSGNAGPDRPRTMELELVRKDGSPVCVEISADFTRDEMRQVNGILGVTRDISERRDSEKERARLEEQLSQAQKMESVGRLAGGVAHDFNNMLSVILGYAELIRLNLPQGDPLASDVEEIEKAAARSRDITRQLLAFSRKQIIAPMTVDLNGLIRGIQKTLFRLIGEDIDLKFSSNDDLCKIKFDPSQMEQVLINLAVNARDAMPNGGKLAIETRKTYLDEEYCKIYPEFLPGHYILMTVSDDGAGMSKETLQHAFEPFFTTKETGRGTGLGLATVYGIVRQNNGFINVYSESGKGTSFKIYIPRSMEEGEALKAADEETVPAGTGTILLVEDDEMVRKMTTEMLEKIGYTVIPTGDPAEARRLCEDDKVHIDLLMTDVIMPGMSGKDLRDRIEAKRPEIKVLFMSGYTSNAIVTRGVLEEGVNFVQKPFSMSELARNVRNAIK